LGKNRVAKGCEDLEEGPGRIEKSDSIRLGQKATPSSRTGRGWGREDETMAFWMLTSPRADGQTQRFAIILPCSCFPPASGFDLDALGGGF